MPDLREDGTVRRLVRGGKADPFQVAIQVSDDHPSRRQAPGPDVAFTRRKLRGHRIDFREIGLDQNRNYLRARRCNSIRFNKKLKPLLWITRENCVR
jgi:hypothetical protein